MKFAYIEWDDACIQTEWHNRNDLLERYPVLSAGFVVRETNELITIARDADPDEKQWRGLEHIPKAMIRKKKVVKI